MNWFKLSQQGLLFNPYAKKDKLKDYNSKKDNLTGLEYNQCSYCKNYFPYDEVFWVNDINKSKPQDFYLNESNMENLKIAYREISNYLRPYLENIIKMINDDEEEYNNNSFNFLQRIEYQTPELPTIIDKYPIIHDMYHTNNINNSIASEIVLLIDMLPIEMDGNEIISLEDFITNPDKYAEKQFLNSSFSIPSSVPICKSCLEVYGEMCLSCGQIILPEEIDNKEYYTSVDDEIICKDCVNNRVYDICPLCEKVFSQNSIQDIYYNSSGESICEECVSYLSEEAISFAEDYISTLNIPIGNSIPISSKNLKSLNQFLNSFLDKYGNSKYKDNSKLLYIANKQGLSKDSIDFLNNITNKRLKNNNMFWVSSILTEVNQAISSQNYMKEEYPNIKSFKDFPFNIDVKESIKKNTIGFTITITPSDKFFDYASTFYPEIISVWDKMSYTTPHHPGVLAYARCSMDKENNVIVINNLQRDADSDHIKSNATDEEMEVAKWIDNSTKNWDAFLLDIIKSICIASNYSCYLTTFDQQQSKWKNLPIHKSKKAYEDTPKSMGFKEEDFDDHIYNIIENPSYEHKMMNRIASFLKNI